MIWVASQLLPRGLLGNKFHGVEIGCDDEVAMLELGTKGATRALSPGTMDTCASERGASDTWRTSEGGSQREQR